MRDLKTVKRASIDVVFSSLVQINQQVNAKVNCFLKRAHSFVMCEKRLFLLVNDEQQRYSVFFRYQRAVMQLFS